MIFPDQDIPTANLDSMHAVDILAFIEAREIPFAYFETPYTLAPAPGDETAYALLREALYHTKKVGIAYVVIQARQHLAALVPQGQSLVLNTLRWAQEDGGAEGTMEQSTAAEIHAMNTRKIGKIHIDELDNVPDDDMSEDDYIASQLYRTPHPPDGYAIRRIRRLSGLPLAGHAPRRRRMPSH